VEDLRCPTCGNNRFKTKYQLHVGRCNDDDEKWTTRKFREQKGLKPDKVQIMLVPPIDDTWNVCNFCNAEFDEEGKIY